ncbi:MAG: tetratricopeptide repeat protein, partial [Planctomycetota bacterium]
VYRDILNQDARHLKARCRLVRLYARMGEAKKAATQAKKLEKLAPDDPRALAALSAAYLSMDRPGEAIEHQKKLVALQPDDISALVTLGEIYDRLKRYAEAIDAYLAAAKQVSDDPALLRAIGKAYENNADPNTAKVYFDRAVKLEAATSEPQPENQ